MEEHPDAAKSTLREPPLAFAHVCPGVFRSGFPSRHNIEFLKTLGLRTLVRLSEDKYPPEVLQWIESANIKRIDCATMPSTEPFVTMDSAKLLKALHAVADTQNHPVLCHCLLGQRQTGVLVGCLRKKQRWSLAATFEEYRRYAGPACSLLDLQTIELLDLSAERDGDNAREAPGFPPASPSFPGTASSPLAPAACPTGAQAKAAKTLFPDHHT